MIQVGDRIPDGKSVRVGVRVRLRSVRTIESPFTPRALPLNTGFDLKPLEPARTELKLATGFFVRSAPELRRVVDGVRA